MNYFSHLLTHNDIERLFLSLPVIQQKKQELSTVSHVNFTSELPDDIHEKLSRSFGVSLQRDVPFRWIRGDTPLHMDRSPDSSPFQNTFLVYLTDSDGLFLVDHQSYAIQAGDAFSFPHGTLHGTIGTSSDTHRLLLGPMNESSQQVGFDGIDYSDGTNTWRVGALSGVLLDIAQINTLGGTLVIPSGKVLSGWLVLSSFGDIDVNGSFPVVGNTYAVGDSYTITVPNGGGAYVQAVFVDDVVCFGQGSLILTVDPETHKEEYRPVEMLTTDDHVKIHVPRRSSSCVQDCKKIKMIGSMVLKNVNHDRRTKNRLYRLSPEKYPELFHDLYLTGCHSILVDDLTPPQKENIRRQFGRLCVTDDKYRLMTCIDERAEPWTLKDDRPTTVYHLALEDDDPDRNFGIYANGLLVETAFQSDFTKRCLFSVKKKTE